MLQESVAIVVVLSLYIGSPFLLYSFFRSLGDYVFQMANEKPKRKRKRDEDDIYRYTDELYDLYYERLEVIKAIRLAIIEHTGLSSITTEALEHIASEDVKIERLAGQLQHAKENAEQLAAAINVVSLEDRDITSPLNTTYYLDRLLD